MTHSVAVHDGNVVFHPDLTSWIESLNLEPKQTEVVRGDRRVTLPTLPHTMDSVRLLRNAGCALPTPMKTGGYTFPGRFTPYKHQLETSDFLAGVKRGFCLNDPGTGKTASTIWAADFLMRVGEIRRVLVLCPLSCVESVWGDEIFSLTPDKPAVCLTGPKDTRVELFNHKTPWVVTNHDGVKTLQEEFAHPSSDIDLVIIDEFTAFKNESAQRTKALKKVVDNRMVWALSGTPMPQNPIDAYFICKLINPEAPRFKYQFQDKTMTKVSQWKYVPKPDAVATVNGYMKPAIRFSKAECLDMPDIVKVFRHIKETKDQTELLNELKNEWLADVEVPDGSVATITAETAAIRLTKALQVCQGIIIDTDKVAHPVDNTPRMQACVDLANESKSKTIIYVNYRAAISKLVAFLEKAGLSTAYVNGEVSEPKRRKIFQDFQNPNGGPQVLVAHPKTASHGLTLTAASTTIWYGPVFSAESYEQANNRTNRPGQTHDMSIIHLWSNPLEQRAYKALEKNVTTQQVLLDLQETFLS